MPSSPSPSYLIRAGRNLVNKAFLLPEWRRSMKIIKSPPMRKINRAVVSVKEIVLPFVRMGDRRVGAWFEKVQNLIVDVLLGTAFIYLYSRKYLPPSKKLSGGNRDQSRLYRHRKQSMSYSLTPKKLTYILTLTAAPQQKSTICVV